MARDPPPEKKLYKIDFKLNTLKTKPILDRIEAFNDWYNKMARDISLKIKLDDFDPASIDFASYGYPDTDHSKLDESIGLVKGQPDITTDGESGNDTGTNEEVFVEAPVSLVTSQPNGSGSIASTATYETAKSRIPESATRSTRGIARLKQTLNEGTKYSSTDSDQTIKSHPTVMNSASKRTPMNSAKKGRAISRTGQKTAPGSDSKSLSDSAAKRRKETERMRIEALERQMREKEEKALRYKQQLMELKATELKQKREEKERRNAEHREQLEREVAEKRLRESAKKREIEKRRREIEEAKKEGLRKRQELLKKQDEEEQARKLAEEKEQQERIKEEEEARKKAEEAERLRQEQVAKEIRMKVQEMKQQKNNSLLQKAAANSFLQKAVGASLISEDDSHYPASDLTDVTNGNITSNVTSTTNLATATTSKDTTFTMPKPKPIVQSYDISDLNSDNESDDERHPRHTIPDWAKGQYYIDSLSRQFRRPANKRAKDVAYIFRDVQLPVELGAVFANHSKIVIPKYEKRTSSAHWNTPPASRLNLSSFLDQSINRSRFETSIAEQPEG